MKKAYLLLLEQLGINADDISVNLKKKIKQLLALILQIEEEQAKVDSIEDEKKKAKKQGLIDEAILAADQLDEELQKGINRWFKNKDVYAENAKKLKQGRDNKNSSGTPAGDGGTTHPGDNTGNDAGQTTPTSTSSTDANDNGAGSGNDNTGNDAGQNSTDNNDDNNTGATTPAKKDEKKKKSPWGLIFGIIGIGVAAVIGVNLAKSKS